MIIGLTGKRGTGKDTVAEHLSEKHGFHMLDFTRDVLKPILEEQGKEVTRDNLIDLAMDGRKNAHNGIWAEKLCDLIKREGEGKYTISGIRFVEEVEVFRKFMGEGFVLVSVICDDNIRYERCRERGTKGEGAMSFDEFMEREERPTEQAILKTMEMSNFAVDNSGSQEELFLEVDKIVAKLLKEN